ncbi:MULTISPECIES: ABC transporter ATP-binding protein [Aliagarivorans]|uniref:ABC transporter ATP-binding protein n=1 Tax=Aliagarivorans TaxID=882379 RepID=UPI0004025CA5|nr:MULTISPECIES: sn-glycerol-3-phosphate ABC transporter ATP-binding protein UgpC [Aliagarivorans]
MASLTFKNVKKSFGKTEVVKGFDLEIKDGEFVVLLGGSGCGKSTTLRMVAGLESITSGQILIGDRCINDVEPIDRDLAMVFQSYALYPHMTVEENICFALKLAGMKKEEIQKKVNWAAEMLQLTPLLQRKPKQLSGGQRQRVAMGRAMVRTPQLFLFDEPLSNLDAKLRGLMRSEIKALHRKLGTTTLYVTHDQVEAMTLADRVVIMEKGVITQIGTPHEVFSKPANKFVGGFIGSPTMNMIPAKVQQKDSKLVLSMSDQELPLPAQFEGKAQAGQEVTVGIRPTDIHLREKQVAEGSALKAHCKLKNHELLGATVLLNAEMGGQAIVAEVPNEDAELHEDQELFIDTKSFHLFDKNSELSLI